MFFSLNQHYDIINHGTLVGIHSVILIMNFYDSTKQVLNRYRFSFFLLGRYLQVLYIDIIFKNVHALEHYIPRKMCSMCYSSTCSIILLVCCRIKRKMKRMPQWKSFTLVLCDKHAFEEKYGEHLWHKWLMLPRVEILGIPAMSELRSIPKSFR